MPNAQSFPRTYRISDFTEVESSLVSGQFVTYAKLQVEEGRAESLGRGVFNNQTDAEGRLYFDPQTGTPSDIDGTVRFAVRTRQGRLVTVINEYAVDELRPGANDRTKRYPFPIQRFVADGAVNRFIAEPYSLTIELQPDADATISTADTTLKMDGARAEMTG